MKNKKILVDDNGRLEIGAGSVLEGHGNNDISIKGSSTVSIESSTIKNVTFTSIEDVTKLDYTLDWFESKKTNSHIKTLYKNYFISPTG